jgi:cytochrome oxidase assembly protein ShyY1
LSIRTSSSLATRFWETARTPRWIAALVLALAIAAGFAALGQWQLGRSVDNVQTVDIDTETAVPLDTIAEPGSGVTEEQLGRVVSVTGSLVPGDTVVLTGRGDGRGHTGSWVVGHLVTDDGVSLAVALGFTTDAAAMADDDASGAWVGRYQLSEEPQSSDFENGEQRALSVADLVNRWAEPGPVFGGYLVLADPLAGLDPIIAAPPEREVTLNLLNVFYAVEWVLFAGFAIYLWYRLLRDAVERADEEEARP